MKQIKRLWIFHHYATLPNLNGHIRPYMFAKHLRDNGVETVIFAASYQHFSDTNLINDNERYIEDNNFGCKYVFIKTPSSSAGKAARVMNLISFCIGLLHYARKNRSNAEKPDIILASSPNPLALYAGIKIAKKLGIPCICEIRDLWPEAIFTVSGLKQNSLIGKILTFGEHRMYKQDDALIFTKEGDTDYIKEQRWDTEHGGDIDLKKCHYINNGVDLSEFERQIAENRFPDDDLDSDSFKVIYTGTIRPVNDVGNILDAALLLLDNKDIKFFIYGDGNQYAKLHKRTVDEGLTNVIFKGFVEKKYIPYILSRSSVNLLNYSGTKYNWSRGNSSNKLFEYMASGKPIISTVKMGYSIIERYGCGIELTEQTPQALADAIVSTMKLSKNKYQALCSAASEGTKDFDYKKLTEKLIRVIDSVSQQ